MGVRQPPGPADEEIVPLGHGWSCLMRGLVLEVDEGAAAGRGRGERRVDRQRLDVGARRVRARVEQHDAVRRARSR